MKLETVIQMARPGDIGLTKNPNGLGKAINYCQRLGEGDESIFGHALIFTPPEGRDSCLSDGNFIESNTKIRYGHIREYVGNNICIIRHRDMTNALFHKALSVIEGNVGQIYPAHRLLLHLMDVIRGFLYRKITGKKPPFRFSAIHLDWPLCSELVGQAYVATELPTGWTLGPGKWAGLNPDHIHDGSLNFPNLWDFVCRNEILEF